MLGSSLLLTIGSALLHSATFASAAPAADLALRSVASLTTCLQGISGLKVVTSSSSEYAADSAAFNRRITVHPAAVVYV